MATALATKQTQLAPTNTGLIVRGDDFDPELDAEMRQELALMKRDFRPVVMTVASGGMLSFTNKQTKEMVKAPLTGVILAASATRAFWAEKNGDKVPFCASKDCMTGSVNMTAPQRTWDAAAKAPLRFTHPVVPLYMQQRELPSSFDCNSCPLNQFGSAYLKGDDGAGKACQERRLLLTLLDGWHAPVIISLAPGSLAPWKDYFSALTSSTGKPYFAFRTEIGLKTQASKSGIDYAQCTFRQMSMLNQVEVEDVKRLRGMYKSLIAPDTLVGDADYYMSDNPSDVVAETEEEENPF